MITELPLVKTETEVIDMFSLINGFEDKGDENKFQDDPGCKIIKYNSAIVAHPTCMTENERPKFLLA